MSASTLSRSSMAFALLASCQAFHAAHAPSRVAVARAASTRRVSVARMDGGSAFAQKHKVTAFDMNALVSAQANPDPTARRTKIVATLGPASFDEPMIRKLILAGVNVFRLNSSHRQGGQFEALVPMIRSVSAELKKPVELLGDLQGPKFRCANVKAEPMPLPAGSTVTLALCASEGEECAGGRIVLARTKEQTAMVGGLTEGMTVKLDDGAMRLRVTKRVSPDELQCLVEVGGGLKSRKGINVPDLQIDCTALTAKDIDVSRSARGCCSLRARRCAHRTAAAHARRRLPARARLLSPRSGRDLPPHAEARLHRALIRAEGLGRGRADRTDGQPGRAALRAPAHHPQDREARRAAQHR